MPKKPPQPPVERPPAPIAQERIPDTLHKNYMPYAMSVIVSRAIPEIDGFKPSHRKLLYTMYKMGLLTGARTKSANVVGQTMRLNPHGDGPIYETMVRLTRGHEALLHPLVDSKGNFGKTFSRDMAYAAARYTEVKLDPFCAEIFDHIDRDMVDMIDNYDSSMKEPALLPTSFPHILVSANMGIAVGMASQFCGFNLGEVCRTTINYLKNPDHDLIETLPAPDFSTGGELIYDVQAMRAIYETGRGGFRVQAKYRYDRKENLIEVYELPYTTTIEAVMDKLAELIKQGKVKEVSDVRDETDIKGLLLVIDLKRGVDPDKLMQRLMKMTPLMDTFSCNFNVLIDGQPKTLGVRGILDEWTRWRIGCVKRRLQYDSRKLSEKLHLLHGLSKILLDLDRAIAIIRETEEESEVVPNLMIGFGIDEVQAEFVAEIKLRHINREYILKRTAETDQLTRDLEDIQTTLSSETRIKALLIKDLERVMKKYEKPRRTELVAHHEVELFVPELHIEEYPVNVFVSRGGYLKKITPASLRMSGEQKYKEDDALSDTFEAQNTDELLVFTDAARCYKCRLHEFDDTKASQLGDYLPTKLGFEDGESVAFVCRPEDYKGHLFFCFQNGKIARVALAAYETVSNRRRLTGAYSDKSPLVAVLHEKDETFLWMTSTQDRGLIVHTAALTPKTTRSTQGVAVMTLKPKASIQSVTRFRESSLKNPDRFRVRNLPAAGALIRGEDIGQEQIQLTPDESAT